MIPLFSYEKSRRRKKQNLTAEPDRWPVPFRNHWMHCEMRHWRKKEEQKRQDQNEKGSHPPPIQPCPKLKRTRQKAVKVGSKKWQIPFIYSFPKQTPSCLFLPVPLSSSFFFFLFLLACELSPLCLTRMGNLMTGTTRPITTNRTPHKNHYPLDRPLTNINRPDFPSKNP